LGGKTKFRPARDVIGPTGAESVLCVQQKNDKNVEKRDGGGARWRGWARARGKERERACYNACVEP
jgi:hypothetical protein